MKKMIVILIAGVVVGITISGLYKHFVTARIMDGGLTESGLKAAEEMLSRQVE